MRLLPPVAWRPRRRRLRPFWTRRLTLRSQSGVTLVEAMVASAIAGGAVALMLGTFSTVAVGTTLAKRSAGVQAAINYEIEKVIAASPSPAPTAFSQCFAVENSPAPAASPTTLPGPSPCPSGYGLRADLTVTAGPTPNVQQWKVSVVAQPNPTPVASPVQFYKDNR
jgi:hypothetical protein